jgi:hypothetical protein
MKQYNKVSLSHYPKHLLKTYSEHTKYQLACLALKQHNYTDLEAVLDSMDEPHKMIHEAIDQLDVMAVKLIIARAKNITQNSYDKGFWISDQVIKDIFDNDEHELLDIDNVAEKRSTIFKILLEFKDKDSITIGDLQKFADF